MQSYQIPLENHTVVLGWDDKLESYFATVWETEASKNLDDGIEPLVWEGKHFREFQDIDDLQKHVNINLKEIGIKDFKIPEGIKNNVSLDMIAAETERRKNEIANNVEYKFKPDELDSARLNTDEIRAFSSFGGDSKLESPTSLAHGGLIVSTAYDSTSEQIIAEVGFLQNESYHVVDVMRSERVDDLNVFEERINEYFSGLEQSIEGANIEGFKIPDDVKIGLKYRTDMDDIKKDPKKFIEAISDKAGVEIEDIKIKMGDRGKVVFGETGGKWRDQLDENKVSQLSEAMERPASPSFAADIYEGKKASIEIMAGGETLFREERDGVVTQNDLQDLSLGKTIENTIDADAFIQQADSILNSEAARNEELQLDTSALTVLERETEKIPTEIGPTKRWLSMAASALKEQIEGAKEIGRTVKESVKSARENADNIIQNPVVQRGIQDSKSLGVAVWNRAVEGTQKVQDYLKSDDFKTLQSNALSNTATGLQNASQGLSSAANWLSSRAEAINDAINSNEHVNGVADLEVLANAIDLVQHHGERNEAGDLSFGVGGKYDVALDSDSNLEVKRDNAIILAASGSDNHWIVTESNGISLEDAQAFSTVTGVLDAYEMENKTNVLEMNRYRDEPDFRSFSEPSSIEQAEDEIEF